MKRWIICKTCRKEISPIWLGCKLCGSGVPRPSQKHGSCIVSSADWVEYNLHEKWRDNFDRKGFIDGEIWVDVHALCEHSLLLRKIGKEFDTIDKKVRFDDVWFFLRGGYPYFAYLNRNSRMTFRSTIFEGLARPEEELKAFLTYLKDLIIRANTVGVKELDIAVIDEVESGSGMNKLAKLIREHLHLFPKSAKLSIRIYRIMVKRPGRSIKEFLISLKSDTISNGYISFSFKDKVYEGTILTYDNSYLLGMKKDNYSRTLKLVMYSAKILSFFCPVTKKDIHRSYPGINDIPTLIGNYAIDFAAGRSDPGIEFIRYGLKHSNCDICKNLEKQL